MEPQPRYEIGELERDNATLRALLHAYDEMASNGVYSTNQQFADDIKERDELRAQVEADKYKREEWSNIIKKWAEMCNENEKLRAQLAEKERELEETQAKLAKAIHECGEPDYTVIEGLNNQLNAALAKNEELSARIIRWQKFGIPKAIELREANIHKPLPQSPEEK